MLLPQLSLPVPQVRAPQSLLLTVQVVAPPEPALPPAPRPPEPTAPPLPTFPPVPAPAQREGSARQRPPEQHPSLQAAPVVQQTVPGVPQATQVPLLQVMSEPLQVLAPLASPQQGAPRSPQWMHDPALHFVPEAVQVPLLAVPQQAWPTPPQVPHDPALQVVPPGQVAPAAMQIPEIQQPAPHSLPVQHGNPALPQLGLIVVPPPAPPVLPPPDAPPLWTWPPPP